jgi:hypothetical protein
MKLRMQQHMCYAGQLTSRSAGYGDAHVSMPNPAALHASRVAMLLLLQLPLVLIFATAGSNMHQCM